MTSPSSTAPPGVLTSAGLAADLCCFPTREQYVELVRSFRDDGFEMCVDLCGVDYLEHFDRWLPDGVEGTRFEVVVNLLSLSKKERVRLRVQAGDDGPRSTHSSRFTPGPRRWSARPSTSSASCSLTTPT